MIQMRRFQIITGKYIFDAAEERDDDFQCVNIYIGHPEKYTKACVFITVEDNSDTAILQNAMYQTTCAKNKDLEPGEGTKTMLQCAIKYVFDTYLSVQSISINDKSMVPNGKIHVTAKRLLQGRMGWYQDALHAIPDPNHKQTMFLMKELQSASVKRRIAENLDITSKRDWGTHHDIEEMATRILPKSAKYLVGTLWSVPRTACQCNYELIESSGGGISPRRKTACNKKVIAHVSKINNSYFRLV